MEFYDLEELSQKCGIENKYDITARVAARARWMSERKGRSKDPFAGEHYLSMVLSEVEQGKGILPPGAHFTR